MSERKFLCVGGPLAGCMKTRYEICMVTGEFDSGHRDYVPFNISGMAGWDHKDNKNLKSVYIHVSLLELKSR